MYFSFLIRFRHGKKILGIIQSKLLYNDTYRTNLQPRLPTSRYIPGPKHIFIHMQAANLAGFRASEDPRFEAEIPDFMNGILNCSIHFNVV